MRNVLALLGRVLLVLAGVQFIVVIVVGLISMIVVGIAVMLGIIRPEMPVVIDRRVGEIAIGWVVSLIGEFLLGSGLMLADDE